MHQLCHPGRATFGSLHNRSQLDTANNSRRLNDRCTFQDRMGAAAVGVVVQLVGLAARLGAEAAVASAEVDSAAAGAMWEGAVDRKLPSWKSLEG